MKRILIALALSSVVYAQTYIKGPALVEGRQITTTSGGVTSLTASSQTYQIFRGTSTQDLNLPDITTIPVGRRVEVVNESTQPVSVREDDGDPIDVVPPGDTKSFYLADTAWAVTNSSETAIGSSIVDGTDKSVLFVSPDGILAQDNPNFIYDQATKEITFGNYNVLPGYGLFKDGSGTTAFDVGDRILFDGAGANSVEAGSRRLLDATGSSPSLDWGLGLLYAGVATSSLDWVNYTLINSGNDVNSLGCGFVNVRLV